MLQPRRRTLGTGRAPTYRGPIYISRACLSTLNSHTVQHHPPAVHVPAGRLLTRGVPTTLLRDGPQHCVVQLVPHQVQCAHAVTIDCVLTADLQSAQHLLPVDVPACSGGWHSSRRDFECPRCRWPASQTVILSLQIETNLFSSPCMQWHVTDTSRLGAGANPSAEGRCSGAALPAPAVSRDKLRRCPVRMTCVCSPAHLVHIHSQL